MNVKRIAVLGVGCAALAVWLAAAATSGTRQRQAPTPVAAAVESKGEELAAEIARLRERLRPTAAPAQTRDLFNYAARSSSRARARVARPFDAAAPPAPVPSPVVSRPTLMLIGIAEDDRADNVVRTAIVSGLGDVFLVKEGESIALQYRVLRIGADAVELTDVGDGTSFRLTLK